MKAISSDMMFGEQQNVEEGRASLNSNNLSLINSYRWWRRVRRIQIGSSRNGRKTRRNSFSSKG